MEEHEKSSEFPKIQVGFSFIPNEEDWKRLTRVGIYHIEARANEFSPWSEKMIEDLGESVKPYLNNIWQRSQNEYHRLMVLPESNRKTTPETAHPAGGKKMQQSPKKKWFKRWITRNTLTWAVVIVICLLCFNPPWIYKVNYKGVYRTEPAGLAFIWDGPGHHTTKVGTIYVEMGSQIDLYRLAAELIPCVAVLYILQRRKKDE